MTGFSLLEGTWKRGDQSEAAAAVQVRADRVWTPGAAGRKSRKQADGLQVCFRDSLSHKLIVSCGSHVSNKAEQRWKILQQKY